MHSLTQRPSIAGAVLFVVDEDRHVFAHSFVSSRFGFYHCSSPAFCGNYIDQRKYQ